MAIISLVVGGVAVFLVAAVLLGRETRRLSEQAPRPVFDVDEAVVWIADRLPPAVTAEISHGEVRRILLCSVDHLRLLALEQRVASDEERLAHVLAIVDVPPAHARAVLRAQGEYLGVIGAAGVTADEGPGEMPPDSDR